jgi:hypothetical protein
MAAVCSLFLVAACGGGGGGAAAPSSPTQATPSAPEQSLPEQSTNPPNVTLSWQTPSTRNDGSPLSISDIAGYEVYYLAEGQALEDASVIRIADPLNNQVTFELDAGFWHFAMATLDSEGLLSEISSTVSIYIP